MIQKIKRIFNKEIKTMQTHRDHEWFTGDYATWEEAKKNCTGYDAPNILEKVKSSLLKVRNGDAVYERDSVLFDHIEYSMPLLVFLLYSASASGNKLNILDFGGSLGSSYFQNRNFLNQLTDLKWSIVEQAHFVDCGKQSFQDETLKFYDSIAHCKKDRNPNAILLSSVLPYLSAPYSVLEEIFSHQFEFIIIDRTPFFSNVNFQDRLTIEHVPSHIYEAEYPAWFFNENKFLDFFKTKYKVKESFNSFESWFISGDFAQNKCMLLVRK
jgi:putative methyltransferase (TIGR04325 family)